MNDFQHKPGHGWISKNKFKAEGSNQPDLRGGGTSEDGAPVEFAAWSKKDKNGNPGFSIKFGPKRDRVPDSAGAYIPNGDKDGAALERKPYPRSKADAPDDMNSDEIPF
jgi:hypothetical protein